MKFTKDMFTIAYVFLHCNGNVGEQARQTFYGLADTYNRTRSKKISASEAIADAEGLLKESGNIEGNIAKLIGRCSLDYDKSVSLLWLLVNMAYADGACDDTEQKLLEYVFGKLKTHEGTFSTMRIISDDSLLMELEDTAEALLAVEEKRRVAQGTGAAESVLNECNEEEKVLLASIKALTMEGGD